MRCLGWAGIVFKPSREIPMKMAAVGSAKSSVVGQKGRTRPGTVLPRIRTSAALTLEEARCPVCLEILLEPVTMPCRHSVCLHCFKRTVEFSSLCCPLCRLRVSSWARKRSREKTLVNIELWDMVRQSYPERCQRRLEQREIETIGEEIFRSPASICKAGEMRQDGEKQKLKGGVNEERDEKKRKVLHHRKEESLTLRHFQHPFGGVLSDSENEEPIGKRTRHVSAFVRRTRYSPAFNKGCLQNSVVQRSRSCTDSEEDRGKNCGHSLFNIPDKGSITHSYNAGILLSSENSWSLSTPVLFPDRRHHWRTVLASSTPLLVPPQAKAERSISPESNDSISEELNHFKPIVCSPCTPPKRLPDGRLLKPTVVKSTPRNLSHSLESPTSYEASPSILQKWKQIEVDRQSLRMTSQGTGTSPVVEDAGHKGSPEGGGSGGGETQPCRCSPERRVGEGGQWSGGGKSESSGGQKENLLVRNKRRLIFDPSSKDGGLSGTQTLSVLIAAPALSGVGTPLLEVDGGTGTRCGLAETSARQKSLKSECEKVCRCGQSSVDGWDHQASEPTSKSGSRNTPTSRKGRKRSQKTKHMEEEGRIKQGRTGGQGGCVAGGSGGDSPLQRMHQERQDRVLAQKLQRQFDRERHTVERQKTSPGRYALRSWTTVEGLAGLENSPRRSGRISKKREHFKS